jgi:transcriptional regulator with XRE-family HTH domain
VRGGELIREARLRAGLTQAELAERTGRERSVIARWEQGVMSPPIETLLACIHACGFDLPFVLTPIDRGRDEELRASLVLTPSERVERMLEELGASWGRTGRGADAQRVSFDPYELLTALQQQQVSFVLVGGFARVVQGTGEVTEGIDVAPSLRGQNVARLEKALADLNARRLDGKRLHLDALREPTRELETRAGTLTLVPEPAGTRGYDDLRRRATREPLGRGLRPQVASSADLARMVGALGREDEIDTLLRLRRLLELERHLTLDRDMAIEL